MANLLESSQTSATTVPQFYTDYLTNLASQGQTAEQGAQYVGAQPLQTQAFQQIGNTDNQFQPAITSGESLVNQAATQNIPGAAAPYLQAGTSTSPLSALNPYASQIASSSPADLASQYMSPYINTAVQSMSDIAQRNLQQNLDPQATAAAVGSGQFGSQRGAQVLGQVNRQAQQDLEAQIATMENTGYGQALNAAGQYQSTLGQVGSTAANAQNQANQAQLTAGQTAGNLTGQQSQALQNAGIGFGTLGTQGQTMNLADVNAMSSLGGQQQQIGQNEQSYPLTKLASLSNIMQGAQIPTTVTSTLDTSPLSTIASLGSTGLGLLQPKYDAAGNAIPNSAPLSTISNWFNGATSSPTTTPGYSTALPPGATYAGNDANGNPIYNDPNNTGMFITATGDNTGAPVGNIVNPNPVNTNPVDPNPVDPNAVDPNAVDPNATD